MAKIDVDGRFNKKRFAKLAENPLIDEIENHGMEDGRFFVHLKEGYKWTNYSKFPDDYTTSCSFGSIREVNNDLKNGTIKL